MSWEMELDRAVTRELPELHYAADEPMSRHTSFRVGGPAKRMAFPKTAEQVAALLALARGCGAKTLVLGNGTNLLAPDGGLDRLVINMSENMTEIEENADGSITAQCGATLARVAEFARKHSLTGLEFAHGIPGTLGGAVCMNAGAYGGEMKDVVRQVAVLDESGTVRMLSGAEMDFSYRHSILTEHPDWTVLHAELCLSPGDAEAIGERMRELMAKRKASQPLEYPSAGSTFKRPTGHYAGALIEQCGLKGARIGGAEVSTKHAGFVINRGDATCADVLALIAHIQKTVLDATGVTLEPEVKIVR